MFPPAKSITNEVELLSQSDGDSGRARKTNRGFLNAIVSPKGRVKSIFDFLDEV